MKTTHEKHSTVNRGTSRMAARLRIGLASATIVIMGAASPLEADVPVFELTGMGNHYGPNNPVALGSTGDGRTWASAPGDHLNNMKKIIHAYSLPFAKEDNFMYIKDENHTNIAKRLKHVKAKFVSTFIVDSLLLKTIPIFISPSVDTYLHEGKEVKILIELLKGKYDYTNEVILFLVKMQSFWNEWRKIHNLATCFNITEYDITCNDNIKIVTAKEEKDCYIEIGRRKFTHREYLHYDYSERVIGYHKHMGEYFVTGHIDLPGMKGMFINPNTENGGAFTIRRTTYEALALHANTEE